MTNQELFDIALTNLRRQRVCSIVGDECRYRGENGARCAVGWAIPDEKYRRVFEGLDVGQLIDQNRLPEELRGVNYQLAQEIQRAHDFYMPLGDDQPEPMNATRRQIFKMKDGRGMEMWEAEMKEIAARFNLNYAEPA
ncbi:hypothetical protein [Cupriavidus sp. DL-D2]|uniref:hypothetical protein n=1 Tax=Cupriavidus sp. DL-D2 TaxID=3144974 RepID=UPI0032144197